MNKYLNGNKQWQLAVCDWPRLFYTVLAFILWRDLTQLFSVPNHMSSPIWLWRWMQDSNPQNIYKLIILSALGLALFNTSKCQSRKTRIALAIFAWLLDSLKGSFAKIDHNMISWCLVASLIALANDDEALALRIHQSQAVVAFNYFLAGLWKLRAICFSGLSFSAAMKSYLPFQILQSIRAGNTHIDLAEFVYSQPSIIWIGTFAIFVVELLPFLFLKNKKALVFLGTLIIIFHFLSFFVLDVNYITMVFLVLILFVIEPIRRRQETIL